MKRPNILFVILDATRADACSCYGNVAQTTPNLDQLAKEGVLYEQAISPAPWTLPAMASLFTGLYPSQTQIYTRRKLEETHSSLATLLSQAGYNTFGISNNGWMSVDFGLQQGFEVMYKLWQIMQSKDDITVLSLTEKNPGRLVQSLPRRLLQGNMLKNIVNTFYYRFGRRRHDFGAVRTLKPVTRWIQAQMGPWFAFVHYMDSHLEYKPPVQWARRFVSDWEQAESLLKADQWRLTWRHIAGLDILSEFELKTWRELYLAEVAYTDYHMGQLIDWLRETERLDDTLVVVTADHGENLGEHSLLNHQYCVYDTLLQVPLVIRYPQLLASGQSVGHAVQTLDLFATMLEVAGVAPSSVPSRSLLSNTPSPFIVSEYGTPHPPHTDALARFDLQPKDLVRFGRGFTSLRTETHKLIAGTDNSMELYDLGRDPGEEHNIAAQQLDLVAALSSQLEQWRSVQEIDVDGTADETVHFDSEVEQRLHDLGYLE